MNNKKLNLIIKISAMFLILSSAVFIIKAPQSDQIKTDTRKIIVLDAGHGKSSLAMSDEEKEEAGYEYNAETGNWGEWRHYKDGTFGEDCHAADCTKLSPAGGSCWYSMGYGDRDTEPEINLNNALAAKAYLERLGYEVRMTRTTNDENPSMNKRVSYCFHDNDTSAAPDASAYICIHSNAGGGHGTSYISLAGQYRQDFISDDYIDRSNTMAKALNSAVARETGLMENRYVDSPYLILFGKCPVPIAYLEIGFYDNDSDMEILAASADSIGKAIAKALDEYLKNN